MRTNFEECFILHTRAFRDTSLLLNIFSKTYGHLTLLAKGARSQRSRLRALLLPFTPLLISWSGKTDLPIASKVEPSSTQFFLTGNALLKGLYINELLVKLLARLDPYPKLYNYYQKILQLLAANEKQQMALRLFEKKLLDELGYGLQLHKETNDAAIEYQSLYFFEFGSGLRKSAQQLVANQKNLFSGKSLLALHKEQFLDEIELQDAERLLQLAINELLGKRAIKSRELLINY